MRIGVVVARFQVPYLHIGQTHLINEVWKSNDVLLILLGSTSVPDERNILPYYIRKEMIMESYPFANVDEIRDHREDANWSENLDRSIKQYEEYYKDPVTTLYGSRDCFIKHYNGSFPFVEVKEVRGLSGTRLRVNMRIINNSYYRLGLINGFNLGK